MTVQWQPLQYQDVSPIRIAPGDLRRSLALLDISIKQT
jgi:hypothetical protein